MEKRKQVGTKMGSQVEVNLKNPTKKKIRFSKRILMISVVLGVKIGNKNQWKHIKNCLEHGKAARHRFFINFVGLLDPTWEAKSTKTGYKKGWKH